MGHQNGCLVQVIVTCWGLLQRGGKFQVGHQNISLVQVIGTCCGWRGASMRATAAVRWVIKTYLWFKSLEPDGGCLNKSEGNFQVGHQYISLVLLHPRHRLSKRRQLSGGSSKQLLVQVIGTCLGLLQRGGKFQVGHQNISLVQVIGTCWGRVGAGGGLGGGGAVPKPSLGRTTAPFRCVIKIALLLRSL